MWIGKCPKGGDYFFKVGMFQMGEGGWFPMRKFFLGYFLAKIAFLDQECLLVHKFRYIVVKSGVFCGKIKITIK